MLKHKHLKFCFIGCAICVIISCVFIIFIPHQTLDLSFKKRAFQFELKNIKPGFLLNPRVPGNLTDLKQILPIRNISKLFFNASEKLSNAQSWMEDKLLIVKNYRGEVEKSSKILPNYNIHVFYYAWYGNPKHDGEYMHWNHEYIQHWNKAEAVNFRTGQHIPPDIGSNFYPLLGLYSSSDPELIEQHMQQIAAAGIGVLAVSWYPTNSKDQIHSQMSDSLIPPLLAAAARHSLKITFHIEPYTNRNHITLRDDVEYLITTYGSHPAFYRHRYKGKSLPLFYIYDSYHVPPRDWAKLLKPSGDITIRNTELDALFIGLLVERQHKEELATAGFDGIYTYFASNGFSYGSSWNNWRQIAKFAKQRGMMFIPSIGPGYIDTEVRPWNMGNAKERLNGKYYEKSFQAAMDLLPPFISITSFNEWHEGTHIEPSIPKQIPGRTYQDFGPEGPYFYMNLTKLWAAKYSQSFR